MRNKYITNVFILNMIVSRETLLQSIPVELPPIVPLTTNASSWILHLPRFCRTPNRTVFQYMFQTHPPQPHALQLYGKQVFENRYSQMFVTKATVGSTYKYSGTARPCQVCDSPQEQPEQQFLLDLCHVSNVLYQRLVQDGLVIDNKNNVVTTTNTTTKSTTTDVGVVDHDDDDGPDQNHDDGPYNCCLVNWYQPHHHIGLHADDERELNLSIPIVSLSWGGPRRFLLRPKTSLDPTKLSSKVWRKSGTTTTNNPYFEIELKDGDLLFMGGKCQQEFKHEIPKVRKTKDGLVGPRISWTIRSMLPPKPPKQATTTTTSTTYASISKKIIGKRNQRDDEQGEELPFATGDLATRPSTRPRQIDDSL